MLKLSQIIKEGLISKTLNRSKTGESRKEDKVYTKEELIGIINKNIEGKTGYVDLNFIDVSNVTDMSFLFKSRNCNINNVDIDISKWDVSNVENMSYMFYNCEKFNSDISQWNTSNVKYMDYMFTNCYNFNIDISNWDVSKVENTEKMFTNCYNFNIDISNWNLLNLKNSKLMFSDSKIENYISKQPKSYRKYRN